jgi:hypothetical protein
LKVIQIIDCRFNFRKPLPPPTEYLHQNRKCDTIEGCMMKKAAYVYEDLYCVCLGMKSVFNLYCYLKEKLKRRKFLIYQMMLDWLLDVC